MFLAIANVHKSVSYDSSYITMFRLAKISVLIIESDVVGQFMT